MPAPVLSLAPGDGRISVAEAAKTLGVTTETVRRHIHRGTLPAVRHGAAWRIDPADLARARGVGDAGEPVDATLRDWAERMAAQAPPLGPGQRAIIVTVLGGGAAA